MRDRATCGISVREGDLFFCNIPSYRIHRTIRWVLFFSLLLIDCFFLCVCISLLEWLISFWFILFPFIFHLLSLATLCFCPSSRYKIYIGIGVFLPIFFATNMMNYNYLVYTSWSYTPLLTNWTHSSSFPSTYALLLPSSYLIYEVSWHHHPQDGHQISVWTSVSWPHSLLDVIILHHHSLILHRKIWLLYWLLASLTCFSSLPVLGSDITTNNWILINHPYLTVTNSLWLLFPFCLSSLILFFLWHTDTDRLATLPIVK